ncbi:MAG: DNA repair protein RadA [Desulfatirhabdiaceae bacterium]
MKKISKTSFTCQSCGYQAPRWMGKCPECGTWESFAEEISVSQTEESRLPGISDSKSGPVPINAVELIDEPRILTGIQEFDRVLGGGLVKGSLVLIGGDPGIGKSTLVLQALHALSVNGCRVLYVSGEESVAQLRMRSQRLEVGNDRLLVISEIDLERILLLIESVRPDVLVVDSIQTVYHSEISSLPGSVSQVRESAMRLMMAAKKTGIPVLLVGHVTKDGAIAGPRLLEHMVDAVLYFEGDRNHVFRILRAVKNRFGSTNEIGVFEMKGKGLQEVLNPSAIFLSERPDHAAGSVVTASMEGIRPVLIELQALACSTAYGTPRRTILGLDPGRVALLAAVMEKKLGMHLMGHDIFMNVTGGIKSDEPAVDMGIISAIASSFLDKPVDHHTLILGEVGLTGEVRGVSQVDSRVAEAKKMGFLRCMIPGNNLKQTSEIEDIEFLPVQSIAQAMDILF